MSGSAGSTLLPSVSAAPGTDMICASAVVHTAKNMPTIVFVIDGSGSMCAPFGDSTRWTALRGALLDPQKGLIYRLQNTVSFGATLYDGTIDTKLTDIGTLVQDPACSIVLGALGGRSMGACPQLLEAMPAALNNAQAIDKVFPSAQLGGSTPTDKAIAHVMDALIAARQPVGPDAQAQRAW